jgi:hypothetical protein
VTGLFIQVSSVNPVQMVELIEHLRRRHRHGADRITQLCLSDVADGSGNVRWSTLDLLAPYLPGGGRQAFDRLFIGTLFIPWTGPGTGYREGIFNDSFRWQNITASRQVAQQLHARWPGRVWDWYITYEAFTDWLEDASLRTRYEWYLIELCRQLNGVRPGRDFMWSPAWGIPLRTWSAARQANLRSQLQTLFNNTRTFSGTRGITWLHLQDSVAATRGGSITNNDAVNHYRFLAGAGYAFSSLALNLELWRNQSGQVVPGDPAEIFQRRSFYAAMGVPVGISWELRYW